MERYTKQFLYPKSYILTRRTDSCLEWRLQKVRLDQTYNFFFIILPEVVVVTATIHVEGATRNHVASSFLQHLPTVELVWRYTLDLKGKQWHQWWDVRLAEKNVEAIRLTGQYLIKKMHENMKKVWCCGSDGLTANLLFSREAVYSWWSWYLPAEEISRQQRKL